MSKAKNSKGGSSGVISFFERYGVVLAILALIYALTLNDDIGKLAAGVAILLFGMTNLSSGFRAFSGGFLEKALSNYTSTKIRSVIFGAIATCVMQSSSIVSVLAISFVSVSLITLSQGIGLMFGANLGNTTGSWLIAGASSISISKLALPIITGGLLFTFTSSKVYKGVGLVLLGLGFFFLGIDYIKDGFKNFHDILDLSQYDFQGPKMVFMFVLIGAAITAVIQSSHATLAIIIAAYSTEQIGYHAALAATLGTSLGGVVTALIASLSSDANGKRLAIGNCVFNFFIVLVTTIAFQYFTTLNDLISDYIGLQSDSILRLAVFHTLFNLFGVVLLTPLIPQIAQWLEKMLKSKGKDEATPLFISNSILPYKDTALSALESEVKHLYENAFTIISHTVGLSRVDIRSDKNIESLRNENSWLKKEIDIDELYSKQIKALFNAIMEFSTKLQAKVSDEKYVRRVVELQIAARKIAEATKDTAQLQESMRKNSLNTSNIALKNVYDSMRLDLARLLRLLEDVRTAHYDDINEMKVKIKEQNKFFKRQDKEAIIMAQNLIHQNVIDADSSTSLVNDLNFTHDVAKELISAINHLYGLSSMKTIHKRSV